MTPEQDVQQMLVARVPQGEHKALHLSENTLRKRLRVALSNLRRVLRTAERDETFSFMPF